MRIRGRKPCSLLSGGNHSTSPKVKNVESYLSFFKFLLQIPFSFISIVSNYTTDLTARGEKVTLWVSDTHASLGRVSCLPCPADCTVVTGQGAPPTFLFCTCYVLCSELCSRRRGKTFLNNYLGVVADRWFRG